MFGHLRNVIVLDLFNMAQKHIFQVDFHQRSEFTSGKTSNHLQQIHIMVLRVESAFASIIIILPFVWMIIIPATAKII